MACAGGLYPCLFGAPERVGTGGGKCDLIVAARPLTQAGCPHSNLISPSKVTSSFSPAILRVMLAGKASTPAIAPSAIAFATAWFDLALRTDAHELQEFAYAQVEGLFIHSALLSSADQRWFSMGVFADPAAAPDRAWARRRVRGQASSQPASGWRAGRVQRACPGVSSHADPKPARVPDTAAPAARSTNRPSRHPSIENAANAPQAAHATAVLDGQLRAKAIAHTALTSTTSMKYSAGNTHMSCCAATALQIRIVSTRHAAARNPGGSSLDGARADRQLLSSAGLRTETDAPIIARLQAARTMNPATRLRLMQQVECG